MNTVAFRRSLLLGCAVGASVAFAQAVQAQAVNATPSTASGSVVYSRNVAPTPGSETVEVQSQSAIIDWTPPSVLPPGPYVFLPNGNVLTFINGTDNPNYVVLNRILTFEPSRFDGTVIGRLRADSDLPERPGGTILFSSPGGIIVGPNALFDVGNLVLTTLNVVVDDNGGFVTPLGGFQFDSGEDFPNAAVILEPGAQIVATAENSYVAMVAPRVEQGGSVNVNGSAAYIAGEQLEFSVNQGLFDIDIAVGSDNANPIIHTGTTGGPASAGGTDNHGVYFVAVPKNQAITMLLQGSVGFEPATDVSVENGVIVLSAGYDVAGGAIDPTPQGGAFAADIELNDGDFTSDTVGAATGDITATATVADPMNFAGSVDLDAAGRIDFVATDGATVTVGQDLTLAATTLDLDDVAAGGDIRLDASGDIVVGAADAGDDFTATAGGAFTGGTVTAQVGSDIVITSSGDLTLDNAAASGLIQLTSQAGSVLSAGLLDAGGELEATAQLDVAITDADAGGNLTLNANRSVFARDLTAGLTVDLNAIAEIGVRNVTAGLGNIDFLTNGDVTASGLLSAGNAINILTSGDIGLVDAEAGQDLVLISFEGALTLDSGSAGRDIFMAALTNIEAETLSAGRDLFIETLEGDGDPSIPRTVTLGSATAGANLRIGTFGALSADSLTLTGPGILYAGSSTSIRVGSIVSAGDVELFLSPTSPAGITLGDGRGGVIVDSIDAAGNISAFSEASGITFGTANAGGAIGVLLTDPDPAFAAFTSGSISAGSDILIDGGSIDIAGATAGTDISLTAAADIFVGTAQAGDDFTADAGGAFDGGAVLVTGLGFDNEAISEIPGEPDPLRGANIVVTANGELRFDNGQTPDAIRLASLTGNIFSGGMLRGDSLTADAALSLDLNDVFVVDDLILTAANGFIDGNRFESEGDIVLDASGTITLAEADSDGDIDLNAVGDVRLDSARAAGSINLVSTAGSIDAGNALPGGGGSDGVPVGIGQLTAGTDIIATAALDVTLGGADAGDSILIDAGRNATFRGVVDAPAISVESADIDVQATGALGTVGTQSVELNVRPTGTQTVLGGTTEGPGYTLTDAEADRIRAAELRIAVPANGTAGNRPPDLIVRELSLSSARTGSVEIVTPGIAQVEGELILADAGAANGIDFTATQRLQILTPIGAVRVRDASGMTVGFLNLTSNNIWAASSGLLQQLLADPNFEGRDLALTVNTGPFNPRGYIEAGDVTLFARDTLFVQNSGGFVDFAGITVRQDTLTIVPTGPQPLAVFAFGRRINPDGSFVTNNIFFREVAFQQGTAGYKDEAQFNLCFINGGECRLPTPDDPVPGGPDIIEEPVGGPNAALPPDEETVDTSFADDPLIEEPVTSGSDSILWDCDRDDDGDCDKDDSR